MPIVEQAIAPMVLGIKQEAGKYGLKEGCRVGFSSENFARTYAGPQVIVFSGKEAFVDSSIRGSLSKAVENIQKRESGAGDDTSSL